MDGITADGSGRALAGGARLLVFGGCHGNLRATEALFAEADRLGLAPREMLCTGDVVAYCAEPEETADLVRRRGVPVVMGNCEEALASGSDGCGCGFAEGSVCDTLSRQWYAHCRSRVSAGTRRWMGSLPRAAVAEVGPRRLLAVHGAPGAVSGFVHGSTDPGLKAGWLSGSGCDGIVAGHSGLPFVGFHGGRMWLNSGAAGMPANDGTPRVWHALLEALDGGAVRVSIRGLSYDHVSAARAMRACGLDNGYADCLETGLWPSLDTLPGPERAATGIPVAESVREWLPEGTEARDRVAEAQGAQA